METAFFEALTIEYWLLSIAVIILLIIVSIKAVRLVRPHEKGVVERLGKYHRTASSGITFLIPFMEIMQKVDMRETVIDIPPQEVITSDNVALEVDAVVYFEVTDPFRVIYNVVFFEDAAVHLAQTNLRNIIGSMSLDETLASRDKINLTLRAILDDATDKWGVRITRVEIEKVDPPRDITEAMSRQMKAERTKRAAVLEAEGLKQSSILRAEGQKQADILEAEGKAASIEKVAAADKMKKIALAEGEAQALVNVFKAIHDGKVDKEILTLKYLEALEKMADGQSTKIFMPMETTGVLSAVATLGEAYKDATTEIKKKPALTQAGEREKKEVIK